MNKVFGSPDSAVADIHDGATVMIGVFGSFGGLPISVVNQRNGTLFEPNTLA